MDALKIEVAAVSIASAGGVRVAFPSSMSKLDLGPVLQSMGMSLIRGELASNENGNGSRITVDTGRFGGLEISEPKAKETQGKNRRTLVDRRCMPRRKVTGRKKVSGGTRETLECGHVLTLGSNNKRHKSRACAECAEVLSS